MELGNAGIPNRLVADASLAEEPRSTAAQLAAGPTRACGVAKWLMQSGFRESLETQTEMECAASERWLTEDATETIAAFAGKRLTAVH